jgi:prolyl-tRNA editing enzyme YbaK/EbsC (Cys-tRNA(Pro) deacylase)
VPGDQGDTSGGADGRGEGRPKEPPSTQPKLMADLGAAAGIEEHVLGRLVQLQIEHEVLPCDPELADTAAFCAHYGHPLDRSANTIVVAARREPGVACACVALATCKLDVNHCVCALLGVRKASFASAEQTRELTGMMIGGVTPFGLPDGLPLFIDAAVIERETVILGGGSRSIKLRVAPSVLRRLPGARVIEGLAVPAPPR